MKNFGIILFCLILIGNTQAQSEAYNNAVTHIKTLKDGLLLIRLEDKAKKLDYYKKQGNDVLADKIQSNTDEKNEIIIDAIHTHYNFSDFAFFYMNDSRAVLDEGDLSLIFKKDKDLDLEKLKNKKIYICTIDQGIIDKEKVLNHPGFQIYFLEQKNGKQVFKRLVKPFPNGARYRFPFVQNEFFLEKEIIRLQSNLKKFYQSVD